MRDQKQRVCDCNNNDELIFKDFLKMNKCKNYKRVLNHVLNAIICNDCFMFVSYEQCIENEEC